MAERPVIVLGAGGHAKVVVDLLLGLGREVLAAVEREPPLSGRTVLDVPVREESILLSHSAQSVDLALGIGMPAFGPVAGLAARRALAVEFGSRGYRFPPLVHPSATIGRDTRIGDGAQVMAGAVVQSGSSIGAFAIVNTRASVDHDCVIYDGVHIGPGAVLGGAVRVGQETLVGIGATLRQGVSIGSRTLIGGGAMVASDIGDDECWMGVPARKQA